MSIDSDNSLFSIMQFSLGSAEKAVSKRSSEESVVVDVPLQQTARSILVSSILKHIEQTVLYVVPDSYAISEVKNELYTSMKLQGLAGVPVVNIPRISATPFDSLSLHSHLQSERAEAISVLYGKTPSIVIIPASALLWGVSNKDNFVSNCVVIEKNTSLEFDSIAEKLINRGYQRRQIVQEPGEFAIRGFVVDVYSPDHGFPLRIELFGDEIESLRLFNPSDQKSQTAVSKYNIVPIRSIVPDENFEARLRGYVVGNSKFDSETRSEMLDQIIAGEDAPWYWNVKGSEKLHSILPNAISADTICPVISEPELCKKNIASSISSWKQRSIETVRSFEGYCKQVIENKESVDDFAGIRPIYLSGLGVDDEFSISSSFQDIQITTPGGQKEAEVIRQLGNRFNKNKKTIVVLQSRGHMQRLADTLFESDIHTLQIEGHVDLQQKKDSIAAAANNGHILLTTGFLKHSFKISNDEIAFYSHKDVFGDVKQTRQKVSKAFSLPIEELKQGDYIVHEDHGIGVFAGLKRVERGEDIQEFLAIEYSGGDRLLIPVAKMGKVQRYSSLEGVKPRVDKLGGSTWQKVKRRVTKAIREMAGELVNLYAIRKTIKGFTFLPDNQLMREFENSFSFSETPDQLKAMEEIKVDMESERTMDRLLCGDVGYGKTELAMRAAVKAAISGKQTAVLAPTTILAQQHYETFTNRLKGFPFTVDVISRFRNKSEQKEVVAKASSGKVDILVGTHRILSNDVQFKDLGLLVIDEEQRFGVAHKEKLKKMRKRIDVLSMTATPIPRTLNLSIAGIREMSLIQTPPRNRMAIQTKVLPFREEIVRSAIEQELDRGGQVFYLRNRVEGIEQIAEKIRKLVPQSRPVIGHAQMSPDRLEKVMNAFVQGQFNVLVSTTIIENGIDIPNANSLIVERADRFGLSQLYQIRGRVGRSDRSAYAYFLVPSLMNLTEDARRRLKAIRDFSDLGAGFRIAAMDLEIRGAGTMLGGEQSGHIEAVGFDLYNRMLEKTVSELTGKKDTAEFETQFELRLNTHIPSNYIPEAAVRMKYYRRCMETGSELNLETLRDEIHELFGPVPESVDALFSFARIRLIAQRLKVARIDRGDSKITLQFIPDSSINMQSLAELIEEKGAKFSEQGVLSLPVERVEQKQILDTLESVLRSLE